VAAFQQEMRTAKADWGMIYYADLFTPFQILAGNDNSKGAAHNESR
jgi:hypothetical protein